MNYIIIMLLLKIILFIYYSNFIVIMKINVLFNKLSYLYLIITKREKLLDL